MDIYEIDAYIENDVNLYFTNLEIYKNKFIREIEDLKKRLYYKNDNEYTYDDDFEVIKSIYNDFRINYISFCLAVNELYDELINNLQSFIIDNKEEFTIIDSAGKHFDYDLKNYISAKFSEVMFGTYSSMFYARHLVYKALSKMDVTLNFNDDLHENKCSDKIRNLKNFQMINLKEGLNELIKKIGLKD